MPQPFIIQPRTTPTLPAGRAALPPDVDAALGPLAEHCAEPLVTDIFVNGAGGLFIDRGAGAGGRHLDDQAPCVDVRLASGIRVHAVLSPVSTSGTAISVRIPRVGAADLDALAALGAFDMRQRAWLEQLVMERANILITGGTGTGKTTLLTALLHAVPDTERVVTIEDVAELHPEHPHHVALESRQSNLEGAGSITLARLVRESLRMRPDRLIVGECRGEEVRELLSALNTGHDGGAGTLHASGLADVPARLEALGALAGMDAVALARQAVSAFTVVVHLARGTDGIRRLAQAGRFRLHDERLDIEQVQPW